MKKTRATKNLKTLLRWVTRGLFITGTILFWLVIAVMITITAVVASLPFLLRDY